MDNYDGYLVFLRCISDGASWLVSSTYLGQFKAGVRIPEEYTSLTRGKWNQDRIYESEIGPQLLRIYQNPQANGVKLYRIKDVLELRRGQTLEWYP